MLLPMTPRTKKTAAALSGALVLASGAYALGSQAGDGSALAGSTNAARQTAGYGFGAGPGRPGHFRGGPREGLADAAKQLGVSEDKLLAALRTLRDDKRGKLDDLRDAFAKSLATELGISEAKVESALDKRGDERKGKRNLRRDGRRGDMRNAFADQLAKRARHRRGQGPLRARRGAQERPARRDLGALATKLGVTEAKLRAALQDLRPGRGRAARPRPGPGRRPPRPPRREAQRARQGPRRQPGQAARRTEGHARRPQGAARQGDRRVRGRPGQGARRLQGQGR